MPGKELVQVHRGKEINHVAVEHLFAAYWAQSYVWWMTFIEMASEDYLADNRSALEQSAKNSWESYQNALKWAAMFADWQRRGW
jgi:hypothetical protein